jgi:hypothetical protein
MRHIIYLDGVTLDDYSNIEDTFTKTLMEHIADADTSNRVVYDKIPPYFTGMETWPKHTNLHCWNCDFAFASFPVFLPIHIEHTENGIKMSTLGNFCTFYCAASYDMYMYDNVYANNLLYLMKHVTGKAVKFVNLAHRKVSMEKYGGDLSDMEFQEKLRLLDTEVKKDDGDAICRNRVASELQLRMLQ